MISGCLIKQNTGKYGGGIYVEQVSDDVANEQYTSEMAHIMTCTVVDNTATTAGGGIWFYNNTRVNSSVFWNNTCSDQANVSGQLSARYQGTETVSTFDTYPFAYSAIQDNRAAGTNNISVASSSDNGVRFTEQVYYMIDDYSVLCNVGYPQDLYTSQFVNTSYQTAAADFATVARVQEGTSFIDIGARANEFINVNVPTSPEQLLLRLYVSDPEEVNYTLMKAMRESGDAVYSKQGSSFAYPFQHLDDAINYIKEARQSETLVVGSTRPLKDYAANLPFEIVISRGEFAPQTDIYGEYSYSSGNTFLVPEGVTIVGGAKCDSVYIKDGEAYYFGQTRRAKTFSYAYGPDLYDNTELASFKDGREVLFKKDDTISGGGQMLAPRRRTNQNIYDEGSGMTGVRMLDSDLDSIRLSRPKSDLNGNGILEPWEFENQSILSGKVVNTSSDNGAYHVVTIIADEHYTGERPHGGIEAGGGADIAKKAYNSTDLNNGNGYSILHTGTNNPSYIIHTTGTVPYDMGHPVEMDGVTVQGGYAYSYQKTAVQEESAYGYYHGGGLHVDGNWYSNKDEQGNIVTAYMHSGSPQTVAYHDIPVFLRNCTFQNNTAGYGGAISCNTDLHMYNCYFAQNLALSGTDTDVEYLNEATGSTEQYDVEYPGDGGCIYVTQSLTAVNTLFSNNEAQDPLFGGSLHSWPTLRNSANGASPAAMRGGAGGVVFAGRNSYLHIMNCDFVQNKATYFPAIYTQNPNIASLSQSALPQMDGYNEILSTIFWRNQSTVQTFGADQVINHSATFSSKPSYNGGWPNLLPSSQSELDGMAPTTWFSCYEVGTCQTPVYDFDLREAPYDLSTYVPQLLYNYAKNYTDESGNTTPLGTEDQMKSQNCNILLSSTNTDLDGPNFSAPSYDPGIDGYNASADWSIARLNNIVDNGWGRLNQTITQLVGDDKIVHYSATFDPSGDTDKPFSGTGAYHSIHYSDDHYQEAHLPRKEMLPMGDYDMANVTGETIGYMTYTISEGHDNQDGANMYRISHDPNPTHEQTYIDMGVYEYVHTELKPTTEGECDVLWVATRERIENGDPDGSCWEQPTSDLQRAIETLLASRNGHDKEIRITEGDYSPVYTMGSDKFLTFYINTEALNDRSEITEAVKNDVDKQYVKSLKISGGWSYDWKMTDDSERDIEDYPATLRGVARSGVGTEKLNYVFNIDDARQWYGVSTTNGTAATLTPTGVSQASVIPITIDGLSLVNANAVETGGDATNNGAAFYYADQLDKSGNLCAAPANGALKLTFGHNIVMASGSTSGTSPAAMYVGKGGGEALIYNSLYHSNYGDPLNAYDTRVVNCTFGLNQGITRLYDSDTNSQKSRVHNSVFWKNNLATVANGYGQQMLFPDRSQQDPSADRNTANDLFTYNALTDTYHYNDTDLHENNKGTDKNQNCGLSLENSDAIYGPNFADPNETATAQSDLEARDFHLQPSVRLMNTGSNDTYADVVGTNPTTSYVKTVTFNTDTTQTTRTTVYTSYDSTGKDATTTTETTTLPYYEGDAEGTFEGFEADLAEEKRVIAVTIDRGAYEFQDALSRIIYVDPSRADGDGSNWSNTYSSLQRAIDLVGVYYNAYNQTAYVYAKVGRIKEDVIMRDGVHVYGSIPNTYNKEAERNETIKTSPEKITSGKDQSELIAKQWNEDNNKVEAYERRVINERTGLAYPTTETARTTITGITNADATYDSQSLIDGFDIMGSGTEGVTKVSSPVVSLNSGSGRFILRNCIVRDNNTSDAAATPVVKITDGTQALLYDMLLVGNTAADGQPIVELGGNAYMVNCTNVAESNLTVSATKGANIINCINWSNSTSTPALGTMTDSATPVNCNTAAEGYPFAKYLTDAGLSNSLYTDESTYRNIWYQLEENSLHIDRCASEAITTGDNTGLSIGALKSTDSSLDTSNATTIPADLVCYSNASATDINTKTTAYYIDYAQDRDVLGNPRRIATAKGDMGSSTTGGSTALSHVDRGCFETWRAGGEHTAISPISTISPISLIATTVATTRTFNDANDNEATLTSNYPEYPQPGSVVYIMPASDLVLGEVSVTDKDNDGGTLADDATSIYNPLYIEGDNGYTFSPAYLLVKQGGSLYGQGNPVQALYVAVEKYFSNSRGLTDNYSGKATDDDEADLTYNGILALPFGNDLSTYSFDMGAANSVHTVAYATTGDNPTNIATLTSAAATTAELFDYDYAARSAWNYDFAIHNTDMWTQHHYTDAVGTTTVSTKLAPQQAVLFRPSALASSASAKEAKEALYRFTAVGATATDYQYVESTGNTLYKTITLTQQDDRASTNHGADFTSKEDMGWNAIGVPYLQGHYLTGSITDDTTYGVQSIYTVSDATQTAARITAAQDFYKQTQRRAGSADVAVTQHTVSDYQLHTPHELWLYYNDTDSWGRADSYGTAQLSEARLGETDPASTTAVPTYIMAGEGVFTQTAATISDKETLYFRLPLWLSATGSGSAKAQGFDDDASAQGYSTNAAAKAQGYSTNASAKSQGLASDTSAKSQVKGDEITWIPGIRLGGTAEQKEEADNDRTYRVGSQNGNIIIRTLYGDEHVTIHTTGGITILNTRNEQGEYRAAVQPGIYIVSIDKKTWKVLVK